MDLCEGREDHVSEGHRQLKLVSYVVTFAALRKGKPMDQLEPHALVFEEWQDGGGLRVLKRGSFYNWKTRTSKENRSA